MVEEKVREGYKKTEVGVIPDEWDIKTVRNICKIYGRIGFRGYTVNDIVAKGYGAISLSPSNIIDDKLDTTKCTYISWYKYEESPEIKIYNGDVLLVKTGSTYGKVACVSGLNEKATINPQLVVFKNIKVNNIYFGYLMNSKVAKEQINSAIVGGAIPTLSQEQIYNFIFPIPNDINEQKGIADALNGVDKLLQSLEKLIDKKKKIKQGTMQQLLTGKKRLPGFSGEWEVKKLGDIAECLDNYRIPLNDSQRANMKGDIPYCGANGIMDYVNDYCIDDDIILIAEDGGYFDEYRTRPIAYRINGKAWVNNHAHIIKAKVGGYQNFLFYSLVHKNILEFIVGGTRAKLNKSNLMKIEVSLPSELTEQKQIAYIFENMDSEIATLQQKLEKYKKVKQGMMQELLTGRIRLI